jgi:hypothetical protein
MAKCGRRLEEREGTVIKKKEEMMLFFLVRCFQ